MAELNINVLPPAQREIWPKLGDVTGRFVLYGGTAVALQLGHRISEDFGFFTSLSFNPDELKARLVMFPDAEIYQSLLHKAVTEVALDKLPVTDPLGAIGDYAVAGDSAVGRPS